MKRIFIVLITLVLIITNLTTIKAAPGGGCTALALEVKAGVFTLKGKGCEPNNVYEDSGLRTGAPGPTRATSDASGNLVITGPSTLPDGIYSPSAPTNITLAGAGGGGPAAAAGPVGAGGAISGSCGAGFIDTAIGCIPYTGENELIGFFLRWGLGIGGGIAILLIIYAGFQMMSSRGDPNRLKAAQELMTSAIAGLLLLIFSLVILRIIGFDILGIVAFR